MHDARCGVSACILGVCAQVKFNVNRVDNMVIQAIALLDTLDKDINTFVMRVREWYSWHFPELVKVRPRQLPVRPPGALRQGSRPDTLFQHPRQRALPLHTFPHVRRSHARVDLL